MNKKILISLGVVGIAAAIAIGGTVAFFSDTETSTGNTFTAGAIDLGIDNTSYLNGVANAGTSWSLTYDLDDDGGPADGEYLFFDFADLKPGDWGEDTISIHVNNNDAWVCMSAQITADEDMTCTEPELEDEPECGTDNEGELDDEINFVFWADDSDNVLEQDEYENGVFTGTIRDFYATSPRIVADSNWNIFTGTSGTPLTGAQTYYIGKAWCFGDLVLVPVATDQGVNPTEDSGISCNGVNVNNASQSDQVVGNISFTAVQARNNSNFSYLPN